MPPSASPSHQAQPPSFEVMWAEIKTHVSQRKRLLLKRSLQVAWPFSVVGVLGALAGYVPEGYRKYFIIAIVIILPFAFIYTAVMRQLIRLEQLVWVDSFYDGRNLPPKKSWSVATRLLWPSVRYSTWLLFRYSLPPFAIWFAFLVYSWVTLFQNYGQPDAPLWVGFLPLLFVFSPLVLIVYYRYFLQVKLRYAWFLFIDEYRRSGFKVHTLTKKVNELNKLRKKGEFKKSFGVYVASDAAGTAADVAITGTRSLIDRFGIGGKVLGGAIEPVAQEGARQTVALSQLVAIYAMYRYSRWYLDGQSQKVNEEIYSLVNDKPSGSPDAPALS